LIGGCLGLASVNGLYDRFIQIAAVA
jgi:hypothetical protein